MPDEPMAQALARLQKELVRLQPAVDHIEAARAATAAAGSVPQQAQQFINDLKEQVDEFVQDAAADLRGIQTSTGMLIDALEGSIQTLDDLQKQVKAFHERVEEVNFPERFQLMQGAMGQLHNTVSALQDQVTQHETWLKHRIDQLSEATFTYQVETRQLINEHHQYTKNLLIAVLVSIGLCLIGILFK